MQISPFGGRGRGRSMRRRMMRNVAQPMPYQGIRGLGGQRPQLFQGFNPLGPRPPGPAQMGYAAPRPMGLQQSITPEMESQHTALQAKIQKEREMQRANPAIGQSVRSPEEQKLLQTFRTARPPGQLQRMGPMGGPPAPSPAEMERMQRSFSPSMAPGYSWDSEKGKGVKIPGWEDQQLLRPQQPTAVPPSPQPQWGGEDAPAPQPPQQPLPYQPTQQPMPVGPPAPQVTDGPGGGPQPIQQPTVQDQVASLPAGFARPQSASPSAGGGGGGGGGGAGGGEGPPTRWTMEIKPAATGGIIGLQEGGYVPMVYANGGYIPGYFWGDLVRGAGSVLSRAAPLASMVPGVGNLAAAGMGALGGVLQGGEDGVGNALKRGLTQGLGTYLGSKAQEKGSEDWLARVTPLIAAQEAMAMGHAGGQGGPPSGRVMPGAPAARRQAGPVSTVTDVEAPASQMYNLFEHLPKKRKHGGPVGNLYAARRFGGGPIPRYQEGGEMEGEEEEGPPRRQRRSRRGTGRRGGRRARTTPRERPPLIDRVQPLPVRPPPPPPPPMVPAVIPQIEGEAPPVEEAPLPPPVAPPPPLPPPIAPPMPPPWLMTSGGGEGGPEGPPPSPPAFTPPQTAPPVAPPPPPPPPNPVWTDESIGEEVPNTVAAAPPPSNVADPADQQWSFFPPGFGGGEGDDEGPTDETVQQATQQQLGSQTIDVETPTVEPPSGPIDWGQTGTTFTLDPGDEGMPPAGENIYGHGRGDIEDAEGSAELPPDASRTDVIRDSARDKGLKTLKDIEEAEPGVADIITKPEEDAAALNLEDSLVTQPQGIDQGNLASVYAQNRRDLGQEPLPDPDPTAGRTMPAADNPFSIDVTGSTGATQDTTQSPSMFDPRGHDPWAMPTTAADFAQAGDQGTADMLARLSASAAPVESYVPVDPTLKYHPATMQAGGMVPEAQGDMSADVQEMFAQIPGLQEAVMTAVQQPDSPEAQEIMAGLQEAFGPDILQAIIQTAGAQQAAPAPQEMMQAGGIIPGNGDAMADDIITTADAGTPNAQDIAISSGEYVIAGDVVSGLGSGNTMAGAEVLDQFQEDVRAGRNGSPQQPPPIDLSEVLPGTYGERYA